jgi:hypothetical protein
MSESNFEQPADPAQFGAWLAQKTRAEQQAKLDALSAEPLDQHQATHDYFTRNQRGITGMSGQQAAAEVAERAPTVGSGLPGCGRPLERLGGTNWESQGAGAVGPIPAGAYANLNRPADQLGESPLLRFMRGER